MKKAILALTLICICGARAYAKSDENKLTVLSDMKFSGYVMTQYQYNGKPNASSNSFNIRLGRLSLEGRLMNDFYWKTQLQVNGNVSTLGSSPRIVDAFVEWQKFPFFNVKLGQFKRPFTYENPIHPITQGFMGFAQAVDKFAGFNDRVGEHPSNGRDIGLQFQGDFLKNSAGRNLLHYQIGVFNGQGTNHKDVNQQKDIIGGFWIMPIKGMRIGAFGWLGSYARNGSYTVVDEHHQPVLDVNGQKQVTKGIQKVDRKRFAISAEYLVNDWTFRTEYIRSKGYSFANTYSTKDDAAKADINYAAGDEADGLYAAVIAPVIKKNLYLKARYDLYRGKGEWGSARTLYELGANWYVNKNIIVAGEYVFVNERTLSNPNYSMVDIQVDFKF